MDPLHHWSNDDTILKTNYSNELKAFVRQETSSEGTADTRATACYPLTRGRAQNALSSLMKPGLIRGHFLEAPLAYVTTSSLSRKE